MFEEVKVISLESMNFFTKLIEDFNRCSKSVALGYDLLNNLPFSAVNKRQGLLEDLQWERGNLNRIKQYLDVLSSTMGIKLNFGRGYHLVKHEGQEKILFYETAVLAYL